LKDLSSIRKLYKPIQPSIKSGNEHIIYKEIQPSKEVEDYIYCYWQLKTKSTLKESYLYRVVSDGCVDIFFETKSPQRNYIMGFCRKYKEFPLGKSFDYFGIRFLPSAFPKLFQVNAKQLSNVSQELENILPNFSEWLSRIQTNPIENLSQILNDKFRSLILQSNPKEDLRFNESLFEIFRKKGFLDIEKDLDTGLSPRQLRRIFNYYIGVTPKAFSSVVRFQHILNAKPSRRSLKENKFYYDAGFYDQAHFIKHFKTFYGVTPLQALS